MDDLISRQAAIDAIHEDADWLAVQGSDWQEERMERDKSILMSLPSAQPEQPGIIRCKDCVSYGEMLTGRDTRMICHKFALNFPRDFYCADAERRTDE